MTEDTIDDGEERYCSNCGEAEFHYGYEDLITCNYCYERYNPIPHVHDLFMELSKCPE
jgi:hypothetical protein